MELLIFYQYSCSGAYDVSEWVIDYKNQMQQRKYLKERSIKRARPYPKRSNGKNWSLWKNGKKQTRTERLDFIQS